jgi:hypothetical protein
MTKVQKIIIIVTPGLIFLSVLYLPYKKISTTIPVDNRIRVQEKTIEVGWEFIFYLSRDTSFELKNTYRGTVNNRTTVRFDILGLEIYGILVLAGAALLVMKKDKGSIKQSS